MRYWLSFLLKDIFSKIIEDNEKMKIVEAIINKLKE